MFGSGAIRGSIPELEAFFNAINTEVLGACSRNAGLPEKSISIPTKQGSFFRGQGESRILTAHKYGVSGSGTMQTAPQRATAALHRKLHLMQSHNVPSTSVKVKGKINLSTLGWFGSGAGIDMAAQILIATSMTLQTLSSCMFASQRSRWCSGSLKNLYSAPQHVLS